MPALLVAHCVDPSTTRLTTDWVIGLGPLHPTLIPIHIFPSIFYFSIPSTRFSPHFTFPFRNASFFFRSFNHSSLLTSLSYSGLWKDRRLTRTTQRISILRWQGPFRRGSLVNIIRIPLGRDRLIYYLSFPLNSSGCGGPLEATAGVPG